MLHPIARRLARRVLGAAALLAVVGAPALACALTLKLEIQGVKMKDLQRGISETEKKNPKLLARRMEQKVLTTRVVHTSFGAQVSLPLPNGARLILTPVSYAERNVKVHVRLVAEGGGGIDLDMKIPEGKRFPIPGGPYGQSMLMVMCTPTMD